MNYYLDTEFLEGTQKRKIFGIESKTPPTIDLISIGIVSEDSREYYAVSKDFNLREAWDRFQKEEGESRNMYGDKQTYRVYWIRENVLKKIFDELLAKEFEEFLLEKERRLQFRVAGDYTPVCGNEFCFKNLKLLIQKYGKTNKEIAIDIQEFVYGFAIKGYNENDFQKETTKKLISAFEDKPKFYAYYADYDWVVFCWLFGNMMSLPKGFPMYCRDLKQILDEKAIALPKELFRKLECSICNHNVLEYLEKTGKAFELDFRLKMLKEKHSEYPKQDNSKAHSAIEDARWNKQFHKFLLKL